MRTPDEIQAAHDRLVAILLGEVPNPFEETPGAPGALSAATDALCWVLQHDHNRSFEQVLGEIDKFMRDAGFVLRKSS